MNALEPLTLLDKQCLIGLWREEMPARILCSMFYILWSFASCKRNYHTFSLWLILNHPLLTKSFCPWNYYIMLNAVRHTYPRYACVSHTSVIWLHVVEKQCTRAFCCEELNRLLTLSAEITFLQIYCHRENLLMHCFSLQYFQWMQQQYWVIEK